MKNIDPLTFALDTAGTVLIVVLFDRFVLHEKFTVSSLITLVVVVLLVRIIMIYLADRKQR